ncbi:hypothetical protein [Roseivirga pacifica]|uniref:hypothetical protein n=1 Tax=Roseivirga pacifica TaxID=1267423 RepID=UPI003BB1F3BE
MKTYLNKIYIVIIRKSLYTASILFLGVFVLATSVVGQTPQGTWLMAYVKAKQPIFTMVQEDGSYALADEVPQDSTFLFSPGLMTFSFQNDDIVSYSWEGEESWGIKTVRDSIYLYGQLDTLFGVFNEQKIILSSTLDDRPTEYHFDPFDTKKYDEPALLGFGWEASVTDQAFDGQTLRFSLQPNDAPFTYKPIDLGPMKAFEYSLPPSSPEAQDQEYGIVYLFQTKRKVVEGVFYPSQDDTQPPYKRTLKLKR